MHRWSFCVGDAVEHVGVDAAGMIWVGYFGGGVFDNYANGGPMGAIGLERFDRNRRVRWRCESPPSDGTAG